MQEFETLHQNESQLYYRIGILETELATAQKRIAELEQKREQDYKNAKFLFVVIAILMAVLFITAIVLIAGGVYLWR